MLGGKLGDVSGCVCEGRVCKRGCKRVKRKRIDLPMICAVDAVGMGANNSELRIPNSATLARNPAQSHREEGVTPHISGCKES